jgi:hypothetical protein
MNTPPTLQYTGLYEIDEAALLCCPGGSQQIYSGGGVSRHIGDWSYDANRRSTMLEIIAVVLVILWLLGYVSSYTMGGFIHALLVLAIVVILVRVIQGRRV